MNKDQEILVKSIHSIVNIDGFDLNYGDMKYILSNMIAKFTNRGKIYLSEKTKNELLLRDFKIGGEIKYKNMFYGKNCKFYKKHKIIFVVDHVIPCGVILKMILESDRTLNKIVEILLLNVVVMLLKDEDNELNKMGYRINVNENFTINNIWGRYEDVGIKVTESYFEDIGTIFR